jgi:trimeric autotransporter adhesin
MQRYLALIALFVLSLPVGLSITGCQTNVGSYCNGLGYGVKTNAVAAIDLEPKTTGISLSWGQTGQLSQPTATTCKGAAATVSKYTYGSSNLLLADISPTGAICSGTWNRNSPGGIADFTICAPPAGSNTQQCTATSCGVAQLTAAGAGVTSNVVPIYVHPPVTAITIPTQTACVSQNVALALPLTAGTTVFGPNGIPIPDGSTNPDGSINPNFVGTITYTPVDANIVTINNTSSTSSGINGQATANLPGSTVINATVSSVSSAAGYFYTCPPKSITLAINGNSGPSVVTPGAPQNIGAVIADINNVVLNGLQLDYTSTQPQEIAVSAAGQVTSTFPTATAINAICQPGTCNEAPVSQIGVFGNGLPVVSNTLEVSSPGRSSNFLWMGSTQSQFFSAVDLTTGTPGSPVKLPFIPNSMVLDQGGNNLYFGSYRELMVYSAISNALSKEDINVPGVVLAVSPDSTTVVINDQLRQVIYLYTNTTSAFTSTGGVATRATFSPDGKNVYIVGPDNLYVHNASTGWSTYSLNSTEHSCTLNNNSPLVASTGTFDPFCGADIALTVPSVAPFITGTPTIAHSFCPNNSANPPYYPPAGIGAAANASTDHLAATNDGLHVLGANASQATFYDIGVKIPTGPCPPITSNQPLAISTTLSQNALGVTPSELDQVVASPDSTIAFVLYQAASASGLLPYYQPSTSDAGKALLNLQLSGAAAAPVAGIFSPDETIFFVSTSGDNLVHFVDPVGLKDTQTINPNLLDPNGKPVPPQMLAVKPRPTT